MATLPRTERLDLRLPAPLKRRITRAANLTGQSVTDFVLGVSSRVAQKILRDRKAIKLSDRDRDLFLAALDRTEVRPLPGLMKAAARHQQTIG